MPGMTGIDLAISLTKFVPDCKVLLFSGHAATRHLLAKASVTGNNFDIVTKPIHPSDMLKRITEALKGKRGDQHATAVHVENRNSATARVEVSLLGDALSESAAYSPGAKRPAPTGGASRSTGSMTSPFSVARSAASSWRAK